MEARFSVPLPRDHEVVYLSISGDKIGCALFWKGLAGFEPETIGVFLNLAARAECFLDIGANTGIYSLLACAVNNAIQVYAFEPLPRAHDQLCENISANGFEHRCHPRREALSNSIGQAQFHVPFGALPTSSSLNVCGFREIHGELIEVPLTTVDAMRDRIGAVDLVKLDVEGFEDKVLEGMSSVLADCQPAIFLEALNEGDNSKVQAALTAHGYRFFHLRKDRPVEMPAIVPDTTQRFRNYLCLPEARLDWLRQ